MKVEHDVCSDEKQPICSRCSETLIAVNIYFKFVFVCEECLSTLKDQDSANKCFYSHTAKPLTSNMDVGTLIVSEYVVDKSFQCKLCKKSSSLTRHLHIHTGYQPSKYELCSRTCCQNVQLKSHMICHSGERPFKCELCVASFGFNDHLKRHMSTHTGERPYKCKISYGMQWI